MADKTFAEVFEDFKKITDQMHKMIGNERFTHKSIGWEAEGKRQELAKLVERIEVMKEEIKAGEERIKDLKKQEDSVVLQLRQDAENYKKEMIKDFEFIKQNKEAVEKKLFQQMKETVEK